MIEVSETCESHKRPTLHSAVHRYSIWHDQVSYARSVCPVAPRHVTEGPAGGLTSVVAAESSTCMTLHMRSSIAGLG